MKRMIFALLYCDGAYVLSRNFRLQRIGDIDWVLNNYGILEVSQGIDELMILDVSTEREARDRFRREVAVLAEECFIPVTVGGGITSVEEADRLFASGADKVLVNSALVQDPALVVALASKFGSQAVIVGCDIVADPTLAKRERQDFVASPATLVQRVATAVELGAGEICIQSVDRDGTGSGLDLALVDKFGPGHIPVPLILMGGVGRAEHLLEGLRRPEVDAVATANLLNFVGNALARARESVVKGGVELPIRHAGELQGMHQILRRSSSDRSNVAVDQDFL